MGWDVKLQHVFFLQEGYGFKKPKSHHDIGSYPLSLAETLGKNCRYILLVDLVDHDGFLTSWKIMRELPRDATCRIKVTF